MDKQDILKLRALPIEGVAQRLGLTVSRHKCLCPFHEDRHPSLSFSTGKNSYKCFVCDAHGGVIDLAMHVLGKPFLETCQWLANEHNVILSEWKPAEQHSTLSTQHSTFTPEKYRRFFEKPFINQAAGEFLFEKRHIDPRVVRWCRLTSWKNWLQIPYYDIDGNLIGVQWRNLSSEGPRFRFPYGSNCHIYNLPVLKLLKPGEELWIAEGCSDCWSLLSSGHKAIAIPSATLLKPKDLEVLSTLNSQHSTLNLHMFPDADIPGEKLFLQLKQLLEKHSTLNTQHSTLTRHSLPHGCKDYSDYYLSTLNTQPSTLNTQHL